MAYQAANPAALAGYLREVNAALSEKGMPPLTFEELAPGVNQLKALIDLLHLNGIAVILDLVYNHAGVESELNDEGLERRLMQRVLLFQFEAKGRTTGHHHQAHRVLPCLTAGTG